MKRQTFSMYFGLSIFVSLSPAVRRSKPKILLNCLPIKNYCVLLLKSFSTGQICSGDATSSILCHHPCHPEFGSDLNKPKSCSAGTNLPNKKPPSCCIFYSWVFVTETLNVAINDCFKDRIAD